MNNSALRSHNGIMTEQVDTSVVGLSSDLELAGMGPATNLCDSFLYVFTFLAVVRSWLTESPLHRRPRNQIRGKTS